MKVILYMATTANGFIGKPDGESDWVLEEDWNEFSRLIKECGVVVMGRKTYNVCESEFPFDNAHNIVMTRNKNLLKETEKSLFTDMGPQEVIKWSKGKGYKSVLVIGGKETNTAFLKEGLLDEIFLSVHPLLFDKGMELFQNDFGQVALELISTKQFGKLAQLHYKVKK